MSCVQIRNCNIGEGSPKVIVPIVEKTAAASVARAKAFSVLPVDFVEWRADWFENVQDSAALLDCLAALKEALNGIPLLVTFRTKAEGGEKELSWAEYQSFCRTVCASGCADLLDVELFTAGNSLPALIAECHASGVPVICSSHDFHKTPPCTELVSRMVAMQEAGADIAKLAVMPQTRSDVLSLLTATAEMTEQHPKTPVVTMSMGALGAVSRICGETFGSAMTFASAGKASAPGQIDLETLRAVLVSLKL